jgi:hypothetical protein
MSPTFRPLLKSFQNFEKKRVKFFSANDLTPEKCFPFSTLSNSQKSKGARSGSMMLIRDEDAFFAKYCNTLSYSADDGMINENRAGRVSESTGQTEVLIQYMPQRHVKNKSHRT